MKLKVIDKEFAICQVEKISDINFDDEFLFIGKTTFRNTYYNQIKINQYL